MQTNEIVNQIVDAAQQAPEKAQELIADPKGAVAAICGTTDFDINAVVQGTLARAAELGLDFSDVDISKLDLTQLDLTKLDLIALQDAASRLNIDIAKLDLSKLGLGGTLGGLLGGLGSFLGR